MQILNIAGYKFTAITDTVTLRTHLLEQCLACDVKGTILLSAEGININLAGSSDNINKFKTLLNADRRFCDINFHETYSDFLPFRYLKVKLKKEIITLRKPDATPSTTRAPHISPADFKQWLDEKRDITILDTRNDNEYRFGTFENAVNLHIDDFGDFPDAIQTIAKDKPIVMFCTGGIRCEKAGLHMLNQGYSAVYQLDGGILGYFKKVGGEHYQGECFVFDERIALDATLQPTATVQCLTCNGPVRVEHAVCQTCASPSQPQ